MKSKLDLSEQWKIKESVLLELGRCSSCFRVLLILLVVFVFGLWTLKEATVVGCLNLTFDNLESSFNTELLFWENQNKNCNLTQMDCCLFILPIYHFDKFILTILSINRYVLSQWIVTSDWVAFSQQFWQFGALSFLQFKFRSLCWYHWDPKGNERSANAASTR